MIGNWQSHSVLGQDNSKRLLLPGVFISNLNIVVLSGQSQELRTTRVSVDYTVAKEGPVCQVPKHLQ